MIDRWLKLQKCISQRSRSHKSKIKVSSRATCLPCLFWLLASAGSWCFWAWGGIASISASILPGPLLGFDLPLLYPTLDPPVIQDNLFLKSFTLCLQSSHFQIRLHAQVPGIRTWMNLLWGGHSSTMAHPTPHGLGVACHTHFPPPPPIGVLTSELFKVVHLSDLSSGFKMDR